MNKPLAEIFKYNRWANLELLNACAALTDEQLDTRGAGTSGTVRELLMHVVGGQQTFVHRSTGKLVGGDLGRGSTWPGFDALLDLATQTSDQLIEIAQGLGDDSDVVLPYGGKAYSFPRSFILTHAAEHAVEHRTEIKCALAQMGIATPDLDGWSYSAAAGYGQEVTSPPDRP